MQLPKLSGITGSLKSPEVIAVMTAAIVTPIIFPYVSTWISKIPFLSSHLTAGTIIVAILLLWLGSRMSAGIGRAVVIGLAGAFILIGLGQYIQKYLPKTVIP